MKTKTIGFIGAGRITRIMLQAFKNKNVDFRKICVNDINEATIQKLKEQFPEIEVCSPEKTAEQDIIVIALHPPVIMETLEKIKSVSAESVLLSLAPKITIAKIASILAGTNKICRLIPNATSFINEGYNPVCFSDGFSDGEKTNFLDMLGSLGKTFEVEESKLEAYAIISAMLPTYFWFQWEKMLELGKAMGLSEAEASDAVENTLKVSIDIMFKSGLSYEEVIDLIPVKPIGEHEQQIKEIYQNKLLGLFEKIKTF